MTLFTLASSPAGLVFRVSFLFFRLREGEKEGGRRQFSALSKTTLARNHLASFLAPPPLHETA